uniref:Uncharacterized protein n=1 Tax=Arundo donax TaxID=35708 RepID=A0A0A9B1H3_ARUDO
MLLLTRGKTMPFCSSYRSMTLWTIRIVAG